MDPASSSAPEVTSSGSQPHEPDERVSRFACGSSASDRPLRRMACSW